MQLRLKPQTLTGIGDFLLLAGGYAVYLHWVNLSPYWAIPVSALHVAALVALKLYRANLRFLSLYALRTLFVVSLVGVMVAVANGFYAGGNHLAEAAALMVFQNSATLVHRLFWYFRLNPETRFKKQGLTPVIIYGAGTVAHHLLQDLSAEDLLGKYQIAAIVDNDKQKSGGHVGPYRIHAGSELRALAEKHNAAEIWFTMPATPDFLREVMDNLQNLSITYKLVPRKLAQFAPDVRKLRIEDLIRRPEIRLDESRLITALKSKRVLITGAAGSIGRELARQIKALVPARLTLIDQWEHGVYQLEQEFNADNIFCAIADVRNERRLHDIIAAEKPQVIFHAAAYKHVPLMESNHLQAIETNILGTWHLIGAISKYLKENSAAEPVRLVNISTDKAVAPENIMGITKRLAELIVYNSGMKSVGRLQTASVRFGNVLGSSGSVVPLFWEQIQQGGPLTVTHPDMERFFMTIPEAVRLVLQAASLPEEAETILALDMGKPVRIVELAERLILLAGKKPHEDIQIVYSGIRPGEKLKEELFWEKDSVRTAIPFIFRSTAELKSLDVEDFLLKLREALEGEHSRSWYKEFLLRFV
ncbi:polysaccharide biosynthesis protein [Turneriella parva]|uniref:Polysaccharide biosynthesis protein CapD n=1 Tax=Turneriella parva (strain ATCC BAA-1111 / DSM 21527 / NCTC 11395 / H) TaxID=869212 RepID=I4B181_TURPD|nr:polysaccharide biosynthesis protein [Turneriella parva]AFM11038.1 polysaccharide biosynthesis protein CapD [Turneriella parva DSM 21527]